jgi:hypothetical protein
MATVLTPLGQRRHQATWRKYRQYEKRPGGKCEASHWTSGRPHEEALSLYRFMIRTKASPKQIADLICVTDAEFAELCQWATASNPTLAARIDDMMGFRIKVLKCFEELLEEKPCLESMPAPS